MYCASNIVCSVLNIGPVTFQCSVWVGCGVPCFTPTAAIESCIAGLWRVWHGPTPVFILALVVALNPIGATTLIGTILGGAGVLGLTIAFAERDALENYI